MSAPFFKALRSNEALELMTYPPAFMLLFQIAYRARRTDEPNIYGLTKGQALIGDYKKIGLTRQQYRTAIDKLKSNQFITIKTTNKGTVATLINTKIFDINDGSKQPAEQPTSNQQATTNKNVKNEKNDNMFDQFYSHYPKKVDKKKAKEIFIKLPEEVQLRAIEAVKAYSAKCQREKTESKFIAHPSTYLNKARWEDEYQPTIESSPYTPEEIRKFKTLHSSGMGVPAEFDKTYMHLITA